MCEDCEDKRPSGDQIVYSVVSKGGGVDGMDRSDKGGVVKSISLDKKAMLKELSPWHELQSQIVDFDAAHVEALKKLTPLDKLVLGLL